MFVSGLITSVVIENFIVSTSSYVYLSSDKKYYMLFYRLNRNQYEIRIPRRGRPSGIMCIENEKGEDILNDIEPLLGPNEDFHMNRFIFTPKTLGYRSLLFRHLLSSRTALFTDDDEIKVPF